MAFSGPPCNYAPGMIAVLHDSVSHGYPEYLNGTLVAYRKAVSASCQAAGAAWGHAASTARAACWLGLLPAKTFLKGFSSIISFATSSQEAYSCMSAAASPADAAGPHSAHRNTDSASSPPPTEEEGPSSTSDPPPLSVPPPPPPPSPAAPLSFAPPPPAISSPPSPSSTSSASEKPSPSTLSPLGVHNLAVNGGGATGGLVGAMAKPAVKIAGVRRKDKSQRRKKENA